MSTYRLQTLAGILAGPEMAAIADRERDTVRQHVADTVGAWVAATATAEGRALIRFRAAQAGEERGAAGVEAPTPLGLALDVATHCGLARLSEADDIHLRSMVTPGAIVVPAAIVLAAAWSKPDGPPADIGAAIVAGYEAMVRLGLAIDGPASLYRGIWPTYLAAPFGVAAAAARLMELDAAQTTQALSLALTMTAPGVGQQGGATTARWLAAGNAARTGLMAAEAARAGFSADPGLLDGPFFEKVYGIAPDLEAFAAGAGPAIAETSFKPWCAARQTMAATQAALDITRAVPVAEIFEIETFVLPPHLRMIDHGVVPGERMSYLTSLPYQIALALLAPEAALDIAKADPVMTPEIAALMAKVRITADESLLVDYPGQWPARIVVSAMAGRHERTVRHVPGDPERPLPAEALVAKFRRLAAPVAGEAGADALLDAAIHIGADGAAASRLLRGIEALYSRA